MGEDRKVRVEKGQGKGRGGVRQGRPERGRAEQLIVKTFPSDLGCMCYNNYGVS